MRGGGTYREAAQRFGGQSRSSWVRKPMRDAGRMAQRLDVVPALGARGLIPGWGTCQVVGLVPSGREWVCRRQQVDVSLGGQASFIPWHLVGVQCGSRSQQGPRWPESPPRWAWGRQAPRTGVANKRMETSGG